MTKQLNRRTFVKRSLSLGMGSLVFPGISISCLNNPGEDKFTSIDWPSLLESTQMRWKEIPRDMSEAPHFGNGLIGSMIWIDENSIRLQVFRTDVHDHADHTYGWTAYSRPRYQIGYFLMKVKGQIIDCDLKQDIYNARLDGTINTSSGSIKIHHLVHRFDDVIFTDITSTGKEELSSWEWKPFEAKSSRGGGPDSKSYGLAYAPYKKVNNPPYQIQKSGDIIIGIQDLESGGDFSTAWHEAKQTNNVRLLVSIQNTFPEKLSAERAKNQLQNTQSSISKNLKQWIQRHEEWWHEYYPESYVNIPEADGRIMYWNNVYRLACCTRPGAVYIDTPGLWNSGGPWPYSTHDFNTQTAHFPVYTANRLQLGEALVNSLKNNKKALIENVVPEEWQEDSALLPLATAFDLRGKRDGDGRYSEMLGCLPWLLNNVWLQYRYSMDKEILKDPLFPLLRRSINLYRHILEEDEQGILHLPPTFSPELGNFTDCNFDLALIRWGCLRLIEICDILNIRDELIPEWNRILENLVEYQVDERGYKLGKERSAPVDHQHMSHLLMIYPLYLENIDNSKDIDLLIRSVKNFQPPTALPKMAASQSAPAAAALGMGNFAFKQLNGILHSKAENEKIGKNGIYYLATPCIETSLSYNTIVQDMLLQSWGNKIRVFPSLPDDWKDVEFQNLRTEGAFLICAKRENGKTTLVRIKSLEGEPCIITASFDGIPNQKGRKKFTINELQDGSLSINLHKGDEIFLYGSS